MLKVKRIKQLTEDHKRRMLIEQMQGERDKWLAAINTSFGHIEEHKVWKLKVHVIRLWIVSHFANSGVKAPIEMVVLDEEGDTIQCSIKGIFVPIFEGLLAEGNMGGQKLRVTLWQTLAFNLIKYLEEHPCLTYVVILQMDKMKFYSGVMGVSNIIYNSKLFINVEFPAARNFFTRVNKLDPVDEQSIMLLICDQPVSIEEDFLRLSVYKIIAEIKEHNQDAVFVTVGTIKEVETEFGWWYKGCKKCRRGLRELEKRYFCPNCVEDYGFYVLRPIKNTSIKRHTYKEAHPKDTKSAENANGSLPTKAIKVDDVTTTFSRAVPMSSSCRDGV
ncbi:hypothetical protein S83_044315, partial [Arachis hypogaea]